MAKLTAPNGATVSVADGKLDALVRRGFKPAKKVASRKTASDNDN